MGMADIAAVLYSRHLKFDAAYPDWPDRDRVILSNGHASMMLYALLYLTGTPEMTLDEIKSFRQWGVRTAGHPEFGHAPGIETTTGPLGQGLGNSVGFALAEWRLREEFGADLCDHRTWVFCGDGCLMEGVGQEAVSLAGHLGLGRLNVLYDDNGISIAGSTALAFTEDTEAKFAALGWHVQAADGHDDDGSGRHVGHGVREFAMGAALNGLALHGGVIAYGSTFLVFSDYMRNAIRLAAMNRKRVVFVMTHDSIGLGEDGPTHQPVEHLASLRSIPGLQVLRPADVVETLEAWHIALTSTNAASLLALSRQGVPQLRLADAGENLTARGGYVLREADGPRDVTLIGTGTEVHLAVEAAEELAGTGVNAAVVSLPSWDLFEAQETDYRDSVLGTAPRIAVEAASPLGWTRYVATEDDMIGVRGYGASAPAERIYQEFGITRDAIVERARAIVRG